MVTLKAKPEALDIELDRTALIVVDMQNSFVSKGGMFDLAGFDISDSTLLIRVNQCLLDASRKAGIKVVLGLLRLNTADAIPMDRVVKMLQEKCI